MTSPDYQVTLGALVDWNQAAMGKGGTTTETVGRVNTAIISACRVYPESLISGAPNRVVGTIIYWTAEVDHDRRTITITHIEPEPRPGL